MRIWTASLVFAMRFIPMTKADFTITHIFRENPTAQKWVGALHGVNLLKRRKTIKEDKHMSTEMTVAFIVLSVWSAVFTAAYIGERYRNRKLRQALKNRGRYARYKESRAPAGTRNAASKNTLSIF